MAMTRTAKRLIRPAVKYDGAVAYRYGRRLTKPKGIFKRSYRFPSHYIASPNKLAYLFETLERAGKNRPALEWLWFVNRNKRHLERLKRRIWELDDKLLAAHKAYYEMSAVVNDLLAPL